MATNLCLQIDNVLDWFDGYTAAVLVREWALLCAPEYRIKHIVHFILNHVARKLFKKA